MCKGESKADTRKIISILGVIISVLCFLIVSVYVFQVSAFTIFKFLLFQVFAILIPGFAVSCMYRRNISFTSRLFLSYAFGYAINIIEYFLQEIINRKLPYELLPGVILIISVIVAIKNRKTVAFKKADRNSDDLVLISFFAGMFLLNIFAYSLSYKNSFGSEHDFSWWCHNSVALKLGFPPSNLFMSDTRLSYHYFSSIQIAFSSLLSQIDVLTLSVPFYALTKTIIMVAAVNLLTEVFDIKNKVKAAFFIIVLFTTGLEELSIVTYYHHIFLLPFGFDVGFAFGIIFLCFLYQQYKEGKFSLPLLILTSLSWMICVGAKAPLAAVLLMMPFVLCVYWLIKKQFLNSLGYGITIVAIFLIISVFCIGMLSVAGGASSSYYLSFHTFDEMQYFGGNKFPIVISFFAKLICANPLLVVLMLLSLLYFIKCRKENKTKNDSVFYFASVITYLFGIALWQIIAADGSSEMYYVMAAFIPAYFAIAITYEHYGKNDRIATSNKLTAFIKNGLVVIALGFSVFCFLFFSYESNGAIRNSIDNLKQIEKIAAVSSGKEEGLQWIRDNTDEQSIVVSDYAVIAEDLKSYSYGIISERQQFLEGSHMLRFGNEQTLAEINRRKELIKNLYNNDVNTLRILKEEGVDYVVQTMEITPNFFIDDNYLELVKDSENIRVYKIK